MINHIETPKVSRMVGAETAKIIKEYQHHFRLFQKQTDEKELRMAELRKELIADNATLDAYLVMIGKLKSLLPIVHD